jgi:sporulation protein YlmC with PRC-barrel domain
MGGQKRGPRRLFNFFIGVIFVLSPLFSSRAAEIKELEEKLPPLVTPLGWYRASEIVDHAVKNDQGEELGEMDDLIIRRNGKVKKAILQVGGFLEIGDRLVAVPFKSLKKRDKEDIVYSITRENLEEHPEFSYEKEGLYREFYSRTYPYGYHPPEHQRGRHRDFPPYPHYGPPYRLPWNREYFPERIRISPLLGDSVRNYRGERVAKIDDLIISPEGKADYVILSIGWLFKERLVAILFKQLEISYWGIFLDVSGEQLKYLPEFRYRE